MSEILVLYYSKGGSVKEMASLIGRGINSVDGFTAKIRTVPNVFPETLDSKSQIPESGSLYATLEDLESCSGIALGSPTRFGNMAAPLKYFLDTATTAWLKGSLENKPASVFTSSGSIHGGNESTLLSMQLPLFHLGMIIIGIPYSEPSLSNSTSGGTPYGASHVGGGKNNNPITSDEKKICIAQGVRLAEIAKKINSK
jgi:NAD(P)H dehydrogenase (quinone)|tara:strand:+ start:410 stop:1006 length:597 start_codon:yes stop_codon:yes gene_type:complete